MLINLIKKNNIQRIYLNNITKFFTIRLYSEKTKVKNVKKQITHGDIVEFLNSSPNFANIKDRIPPKLLRRNAKIPEDLYLIDESIAKIFASTINKLLKLKQCTLIEANPGLGLLTEELRKFTKTLEVFETNICFHNQLVEKYKKSNVIVSRGDFYSIWKQAYQDKMDNGNRLEKILKNISVKPWENGTSIKVVGALTNTFFIKHLITSILFQNSIANYGRYELVVALLPTHYTGLTASPKSGFKKYTATSVLFQLLFDITFLQKLPRNVFLPWQSLKKSVTGDEKIESDVMYLVHIEAKKKLPVQKHQLQFLWYFVRHHMISRTSQVIAQLESWIPGCGPQFIISSKDKNKKEDFKNLSIFTQFGELTPQQILNLFEKFISLPEFSESSFLASMENCLIKLEGLGDDSSLDLKRSSESASTNVTTKELEESSDDEESKKAK